MGGLFSEGIRNVLEGMRKDAKNGAPYDLHFAPTANMTDEEVDRLEAHLKDRFQNYARTWLINPLDGLLRLDTAIMETKSWAVAEIVAKAELWSRGKVWCGTGKPTRERAVYLLLRAGYKTITDKHLADLERWEGRRQVEESFALWLWEMEKAVKKELGDELYHIERQPDDKPLSDEVGYLGMMEHFYLMDFDRARTRGKA